MSKTGGSLPSAVKREIIKRRRQSVVDELDRSATSLNYLEIQTTADYAEKVGNK